MRIRCAKLFSAASCLGAVVLLATTAAVLADPLAPSPDSGPAKLSPNEQLRGIEDTMRESEAQRKKIEAEVESIRADRARLNSALIDTTARVQDSEAKMQSARERVAGLSASEGALQQSLRSRSGVIADVLAILQRMGRNPPPAILVRPKDMSEAIRAAILLGAVIPDLKAETEALARDLDDLEKLRQSISKEQQSLSDRTLSLREDKARLSALVDARQRSLTEAEAALGSERGRAHELARQAANLKDLIAHMESDIAAAKAAANSAQAAAADIKAKAASLSGADPARLKPALAFADTRGHLALPVFGPVLKSFGEADAYGGSEKGISLATPSAATVASPIDGWVVFSGPYRTYGQLLILNAGDGYYMVLAGMDRINVTVGQFVLTGEPVAVMGDGATRTAAAAAIGAAQPVLYIELRKNGAPIDPGPWWAKADIEKARG